MGVAFRFGRIHGCLGILTFVPKWLMLLCLCLRLLLLMSCSILRLMIGMVAIFDAPSVVAIFSSPKLCPSREDQWIWADDLKGMFSVAGAYRGIKQWPVNTQHPFRPKDWSRLWKLCIQDRLKLHLWKCAQNALPMRGVVAHIVNSDSDQQCLCSLCGLEAESAEHLFLRCQVARVVWHGSFWPLLIERFVDSNIAEFILGLLYASRTFGIPKVDCRNFTLAAALVLDSLWYLCNDVIHNKATIDPFVVIQTTRRGYLEHSLAWNAVEVASGLFWRPSPVGSWKCNVDVAVRSSHSVLTVVVRDSEGSLCSLYTERLTSQDPLVGEMAALWAAVRLVEDKSWPQIIFESDCLSVVQDVLHESPVAGWQMEDWLPGIRRFFSMHAPHSLCWIPRRQNKLAHRLAKWAASAVVYGFISLSAIPAHVFCCDCL
ncbi:hypothetical protein CJ030_MR0G020163 [Morella rubra]|uniref:Reverse transcriptase zinc-binding domain-containing protein n=1 Tax=Morella rubra TaxID=262757 RepID=A0A6A1UGK8_9ROSI|nr:hypothetical protein CJ030_MR0G020163 [Morella rubra]